MTATTVSVRPDAVAVLTFDQPGSRANVLSPELWAEFGAALAALAARPGLKGVVLASAKPGVFIAGADLKLLAAAPGPNDPAVRAFIEQGLRVLEQLEALPVPTCAAVDGAALGGGLEVALACDERVAGAHPKVRLGLPEVTLNLIPGWGGTQRLPRLVGVQRALEIVPCALELDAGAAVEKGLVAEAGGSDDLIDRAARRLLALDPGAVRARRAARQGPVPNEPVEVRDPAELGHLTAAQWNNIGLAPVVFEAYRDYVRTGMADSLNRAACLALFDVIEAGAPLPLADALKVETEAFMRLAGSDESKRLIAAFFAGRKK